jgi:hypothetical protein
MLGGMISSMTYRHELSDWDFPDANLVKDRLGLSGTRGLGFGGIAV